MPKIRTNKATAKRFRVTKKKKVMQRKAGQDHYNSKETGKKGTKKRRDIKSAKADIKNIKTLMPYK